MSGDPHTKARELAAGIKAATSQGFFPAEYSQAPKWVRQLVEAVESLCQEVERLQRERDGERGLHLESIASGNNWRDLFIAAAAERDAARVERDTAQAEIERLELRNGGLAYQLENLRDWRDKDRDALAVAVSERDAARALVAWIDGKCVDEAPYMEIREGINRYHQRASQLPTQQEAEQ